MDAKVESDKIEPVFKVFVNDKQILENLTPTFKDQQGEIVFLKKKIEELETKVGI